MGLMELRCWSSGAVEMVVDEESKKFRAMLCCQAS